jgi:hypothetical protein
MANKWWSEAEIEEQAGKVLLTENERHEAAAAVARQCTAVVARCLIVGNFTDLMGCMRREEYDRCIKKAVETWIASTGAIYDPHRRKWLVTDDGYCCP